MSNLHHFLVEHAKFPFPRPDEHRSVDTINIPEFQVGLLERVQKANHAVRDDTLITKLCRTFQNILGDSLLPAEAESYLQASFSPILQFDEGGTEDEN